MNGVEMKIDSILVRNLTGVDLLNMERDVGQGPTGGGGQTFIDLPLGQIGFEGLSEFLSVSVETLSINHEEVTIHAIPIGNGQASNITFSPRGGANPDRYRIRNQNRHRTSSERHDGWGPINGFPAIAATANVAADIPNSLYENIKLYIIKMTDGRYYVGYIDSISQPVNWPDVIGLNEIFTVGSCDIIHFSELCQNPTILELFAAWKHKPSVLLYGPPGTGKTHLMNILWEALNGGDPIQCLSVNSADRSSPFYFEDLDLPFEGPIRTRWLTFHQNYSYENFILTTKPVPHGATFNLKPYAGSLIDAALSIDPVIQAQNPGIGNSKTALIFIDELNRGNVSRIFGELITFMDFEYREGIGHSSIPVPLNNLNNISATRTEKLTLENGIEVDLPIPWCFPKNVYILASMNSVDKAVAPLDSALSRRLHKINIFPSMKELASYLTIPNSEQLLDMQATDTAAIATITAEEVAWLLLYRLNYELSTLMGKDFELGQSYLYSLKTRANDDAKYHELAKIWDKFIYPQIQERFANRSDEILRILRIDAFSTVTPTNDYLFEQKKKPLAHEGDRDNSPWTLKEISLEREFVINPDRVKYTLKFLSGISI